VVARAGVRSYSEGESPQRYVVIAREGGDKDDSEEE
jgi:predicted RNA-binding protein Jag